nr:pectinesterase 1-like [Ipomoea batatas]GMC85690.1 pectinesterase 1-like [Ipomoea batatas]GMC88309.1 pectinesterase 1-like [Ipomoea batatas]GMD42368.1 pectinesterase 1-like [Ipomoea batatas]GME01104.1 pectinesterase 1-like [Ipomoea batatas]
MGTVTQNRVIILLLFLLCVCPCSVLSDDTVPVPAEKTKIESWFKENVQPLSSRKGLDPALLKAEAEAQHLTVGKGGKFKTITEAIKSIPTKNTKRQIITIAGGNYTEKVKIEYTQHFITFFADPKDRPNIIFDGTADKYGTVYSATVQVEADYFSAVNINFVNSAPRPSGKKEKEQAVALTVGGDKASFYNCKFFGYQDTLCDNHNKHFYKDCYIEGTVDFVFGDAKTMFLNTELHVIDGNRMAMISAHGRKSEKEDTGFAFVHCKVTGTDKVAVLGRGWFDYSKTVFLYNEVSDAIKPEGWLGLHANTNEGGGCYFAEYKNTGKGADAKSRPKFVHMLTDAEAKPYLCLSYIEASKWLLPPITKG